MRLLTRILWVIVFFLAIAVFFKMKNVAAASPNITVICVGATASVGSAGTTQWTAHLSGPGIDIFMAEAASNTWVVGQTYTASLK